MLPFTGLNDPGSVAVDTAGNVYVADKMNHRVVKLEAGSSTQTVLPFPTGPDGLQYPAAVAVDKEGTVYVSDCSAASRVWKLEAGTSTPFVLLNDVVDDFGLAVDEAGNLYGTAIFAATLDTHIPRARVWKLAAPTGSTPVTELPFTGLHIPSGVAVDTAGNLYVIDRPRGANYGEVAGDPKLGSHQVVKLSADLTTQTVLPFTVNGLRGVAVDSAGTVYISNVHNAGTNEAPVPDDIWVLKLEAGSSTQTVLPFTGLKAPKAVAVRPPWMGPDPAGNVYVSDVLNNQVLKLGAG